MSSPAALGPKEPKGTGFGAVVIAGKSESAEKEFQKHTSAKVKDLFNSLRRETSEIEANIAVGQKEVLDRDQHAFTMRRQELAIAYMQAAHAIDLQKHKEALDAILVARRDRKKAKQENRKAIRASKRRDQTIQQQKKSADAAARIRESIAEKRAAFDALTQHLYDIHEKQRRNLIRSQERTFSNERLLVDLETRHLKDEVRTTILKKFQVRQNHQGHLNKRINDNLRELQLMELRHSKEKFELEMVGFEEIGSKKIIHENSQADMRLRHQTEMHNEKEAVITKREAAKEESLKQQHAQALKALAYNQRIELRQLRIKHDLKNGSALGSKNGSKPHSRIGSGPASRDGSTCGSDILTNNEGKSTALPRVLAVDEEVDEEFDGEDDLRREFGNIEASLLVLAKRHKEEARALEATIKKELNDINLSFEVKLSDMEEAHNDARVKLIEDQEREIEELKRAQEKEIKVEEMMHDSEMKMLVERRLLNSVLETVSDGIINITTTGDIVRFNHAAEGMFGYKSHEVIGKNITMLMPYRYAKDHHRYLENYLTTGVKKGFNFELTSVIGSGRRLVGLKKSGEEFPMHLSISELKEDGEHMFTGIARDLTEEVALENKTKEMEAVKKREMEALLVQLNQAKTQSDNLLGQMLPATVSKQLMSGRKVEPQSFKSATVFFLDVVGFTTISAQVDPLEIVDLLNNLYSVIDRVIERYDVYKVETIGDSYMIVSGLPVEISTHAEEIASMALHMMWAIDNWVYKAKPELKIRVRMGINSGAVVAGCVGTKMPRYCLFGDTVNTASRMESSGAPMKIQMSESTATLLKKSGKFLITCRGELEVKGKGKMTLYWLDGKQNFDPAKLPSVFEEAENMVREVSESGFATIKETSKTGENMLDTVE